MTARTSDLYGAGVQPEPATPGTFGMPPRGAQLPASLKLGRVKLQVGDLARSVDYYQRVLGLRVADRGISHAVLTAADGNALVEVHERRGARPAPRRGSLGLYHFAILLPDRPSLGRFVRHLGELGERAGASDHLVSEAFYLQDPDNLGIEVYADRPRETWRRIGRELMMASDPIDMNGLIDAAGNTRWSEMPAGTTMGHLHLHVGDIEQGAAFYADTLGFDRTAWRYPGAMFYSAGGYHHHVGTNTWAGPGATAPPEDQAQLLAWTMRMAVRDVAALGERAAVSDELAVRDPWGTTLQIEQEQER